MKIGIAGCLAREDRERCGKRGDLYRCIGSDDRRCGSCCTRGGLRCCNRRCRPRGFAGSIPCHNHASCRHHHHRQRQQRPSKRAHHVLFPIPGRKTMRSSFQCSVHLPVRLERESSMRICYRQRPRARHVVSTRQEGANLVRTGQHPLIVQVASFKPHSPFFTR